MRVRTAALENRLVVDMISCT